LSEGIGRLLGAGEFEKAAPAQRSEDFVGEELFLLGVEGTSLTGTVCIWAIGSFFAKSSRRLMGVMIVVEFFVGSEE